MEEGINIAYAVLLLLSAGLLYVMWRIMKRNQSNLTDDNLPAIAGADELTGAAKDPSQFDEPDDEALEEMADVLAAAAEAQGIEYQE